MPADLLTVAEAATALGLSIPGLQGALRRKTLTATRLPQWRHRVFIRREEIERYRRERLGKAGRTKTPATAPAE